MLKFLTKIKYNNISKEKNNNFKTKMRCRKYRKEINEVCYNYKRTIVEINPSK